MPCSGLPCIVHSYSCIRKRPPRTSRRLPRMGASLASLSGSNQVRVVPCHSPAMAARRACGPLDRDAWNFSLAMAGSGRLEGARSMAVFDRRWTPAAGLWGLEAVAEDVGAGSDQARDLGAGGGIDVVVVQGE